MYTMYINCIVLKSFLMKVQLVLLKHHSNEQWNYKYGYNTGEGERERGRERNEFEREFESMSQYINTSFCYWLVSFSILSMCMCVCMCVSVSTISTKPQSCEILDANKLEKTCRTGTYRNVFMKYVCNTRTPSPPQPTTTTIK